MSHANATRVTPTTAVKKLVTNQTASVALLTTSAETKEIIAVFEALASVEGWKPGDNLSWYADRSVYLAAVDSDQFVGGIQLVLGDFQRPLPFVAVWPEICAPRGPHIGHVLILALDKEHRGGMGFFGLLSLCLWRECKERGIAESGWKLPQPS